MRYDTILRLSESIINRHRGGFTFFHGVNVDKNDSESKRFPLAYLVPIPSNDETAGDDTGSRTVYSLTFFLVGVLAPDREDREVSNMVALYTTACQDIVGEFRRYGELQEDFNGEELDFEITTQADYLPIIDNGSTNMTGCQVTFTITDNQQRVYCENDNFVPALEVNELNQLILDDRDNAIAVSDDTMAKVLECLPVTITDGENIIVIPSGGTYTCEAGGGEDATVENSDQTFTDTVASGGTLVLDDITHTQTDGSPEILPAQIALVCDAGADATVENSTQSFTDTVGSGDTLVLNDISHTDSDLSTVILPAQIAMVCTPGTFVPEDITGLQLYFNKKVARESRWVEQSTNQHDVFQSTGTKQPVISANSVDFDGIDDVMTFSVANLFAADTSGIMFFSFYHTAGVDQDIINSSDAASNTRALLFQTRGNNIRLYAQDGGTADTISGQTALSDGYNYAYIKSDGATTTMNLNGSNESLTVNSGSNVGRWFNGVTLRDNISIGSVIRQTDIFRASKVNKALYYNSAVSAGEITSINNFMSDPTN